MYFYHALPPPMAALMNVPCQFSEASVITLLANVDSTNGRSPESRLYSLVRIPARCSGEWPDRHKFLRPESRVNAPRQRNFSSTKSKIEHFLIDDWQH